MAKWDLRPGHREKIAVTRTRHLRHTQQTSGMAVMYGGVYGFGMWLDCVSGGLKSCDLRRKSPRALVGCSLGLAQPRSRVQTMPPATKSHATSPCQQPACRTFPSRSTPRGSCILQCWLRQDAPPATHPARASAWRCGPGTKLRRSRTSDRLAISAQ